MAEYSNSLLEPTYIPKKCLSEEAMEFLEILCVYGLQDLATALENSYYVEHIPVVTYFILNSNIILNEILSHPLLHVSKRQQLKYYFNNFDIVKNFTDEKLVIIKTPFYVPKHNLYNTGIICHLNSCISLLSSMTLLVDKINDVITAETCFPFDDAINPCFNTLELIYSYIQNSYSRIDINPKLIFDLIKELKVNPTKFDECTESMKKIMRIFYACEINKSLIFFWDSTDEFLDADLDLSLYDRIAVYCPKYFVVNIHDMNSILDIDTDKVNVKSFSVQTCRDGMHKLYMYKLVSIIAYYPGHLVALFDAGNEHFKVIDDMTERYTEKYISYEELFSDSSSHVIGCYLRY